MDMISLPHGKLRLSDANVRKTNAQNGLEALAASIAEHGLLQPLIVSPSAGKKTLYDVHAGGRRWRAIGLLIERGTLPKDYAVDVRLCENEAAAAREISLAENLLRESMTPADEAQAYRDIIAQGATVEDVARRFGVTMRHVQGRLRLADLAEPIFKALAEGTITLDVAMAYGVTGDRERQLAAWERLSQNWQSNNAQAIRRAIAESTLSASHPVALFLTEAEYTGAGGRVEGDLFTGEGQGMWLDGELALELAQAKLQHEAEVAALGTKLGWVKPLLATNVPYSETEDLQTYWPTYGEPGAEAKERIATIEARLVDIEFALEEVEEGEAEDALYAEQENLTAECDRLNKSDPIIPDEDRPHVGTFLILDREGQPCLAPSYYTTQKKKRGQPSAAAGGEPQAGEQTPAADPMKPDETNPRSLEEQLAKDRRDVLALHIANDPGLALDITIFQLARPFAGHFGYSDTGCAITISDRFEPAGIKAIPESEAQVQLGSIKAALPCDWGQEHNSFASFLAFRALDEEAKAGWLAFAVSQSLKASLAQGQYSNAFQTGLGALLDIEVAQHWRPSAERYFDRKKKGQILTILGGIDPEAAGRYATAKKSELASAAARLCAGETIVQPSVKERALAWVPDEMRFEVSVQSHGEGARDESDQVAEQDPAEDFALSDGADGDLDEEAEAEVEDMPEAEFEPVGGAPSNDTSGTLTEPPLAQAA